MEDSTLKETIPLLDSRVADEDDELEVEIEDKEAATGGVVSAIFNLTNTVIGAGMLSLPFAFEKTGIVLGPVLLAAVWFLVVYSCFLLLRCGKLTSSYSYISVAQKAYGMPGVLAAQLSVAISCFGAFTSYFVIVGDVLSPLIAEWMGGSPKDYCSFLANRRFSIILSLCIVAPLCMLKSIDSLKYTSYMATVAIIYLVIIVVVQSGQSISAGVEELVSFANVSESIFRAVPIITLAYTCQMNLFSLLTTMRNPSKRRVRAVVYGALGICLLAYLVVGVFGYLTFFSEVRGNILLNYEVGDIYVSIGRLGVGVVVVFSFPLMCHPTLDVVDIVLFPNRPFSYTRRFFEMLVVVGLAFTIAMLVDDVSVVLGMAGATGSTSISFILPPLLFLKLAPKSQRLQKVVASMVLTLGIIIMGVSCVVTIMDAANHKDDVQIAAACNRTAL